MPYAKAAVTFLPTHKLVIVGNHKPDISDVSHGMWRRVLLVGFDQIIPESGRDKDLFDKLKGEGAGLLNWALEGLRQWRDQGLSVPDSVKRATADYRDEQDVLGEWIADNCITGSDCSVGKHELYADYTMWAQANGHGQLSQSKLTRRLNDRGFKLQPDKRTVGGLRLITPGSLGRSPQRLRT